MSNLFEIDPTTLGRSFSWGEPESEGKMSISGNYGPRLENKGF